MKPIASLHAFTLAETMIAMVASVLIIGALMAGAMGLRNSSHASDVYNTSQADQRRLVDYLARDLRRSIGIAATDANGAPAPVAGEALSISDKASLVLTLPGYYKSNVPASPEFSEPLPFVASSDGVGYGTNAGPAPGVVLSFRKVFVADEGSVCFVRQEADAKQVIVRRAENLHARVTIGRDERTGVIEAWFRPPGSGARPVVSTYDQIMLRNMRIGTLR